MHGLQNKNLIFVLWLLEPWRWYRYVPKRRSLTTNLYGVNTPEQVIIYAAEEAWIHACCPAFHRQDKKVFTCDEIHSALHNVCCPFPQVTGLFVQYAAVNINQHLMSKCWYVLFIKLIYLLVLPATKPKVFFKSSFARKLQSKKPSPSPAPDTSLYAALNPLKRNS